MRIASLFMVLALAASCGSKQKTGTGDGTGTEPTGDGTGTEPTGDGTGTEPTGKRKAWADLTVAEKKEVMKKEVVPKMRELWKSSPEPDEDVDCTTCHGDKAMDGEFDMPNKDLPLLDFTTGLADVKKEKDGQAWLDFMGKVKGEMAGILGMPEMSQETPTGFGCGNCHGNIKF